MAGNDNELYPGSASGSPADNPLAPGVSWSWGDPEAYGAAEASKAIAPAMTSYLRDVVTGNIAAQGLQRQFPDIPYDPSKSFAANVQDPARAEAAQGVALSFAPGMIVGPVAAGQMTGGLAKLQSLDKAEAMEAGAWPHNGPQDRDAIFDATGWFRDEDKAWKFVMSDENASLNTDKLAQNYKTVDPKTGDPVTLFNVPLYADPDRGLHLSDILQHDDLYNAYPWMKDVNIKPMPPDMVKQASAGINNEANTIFISPLDRDAMFSSVAHETQHIIQKAEGFARGGASKEFLPPDYHENLNAANLDRDDVEWHMRNAGYDPGEVSKKLGLYPNHIPEPYHPLDLSGLNPDLLSRYKSVTEYLGDLHDQRVESWKNYLKLGGEVEARSVQGMLHARVWDQPPWRVGTYDQLRGANVPYPEPGTQIIRHQGRSWNATPMPDDYDPFAPQSGGGQ